MAISERQKEASMSSAVSPCWIVTENKKNRVLACPSRDNIIRFILHQLKISPIICALPHGIESSKNFQTLPHNHIRPPTLDISDPDVILFVHKYPELVVMRMSPGKWGILLNVPFLHYTLMSAQQYDIKIDYFWFCSYSAMTLRKILEDSDQLICNELWICTTDL